MAELKTQLDLQQIPKIVGEDGTQLLARCYAVLEHTRWPLYIVGPSGSGKSIIAMNLARQYALAKNVPAYYVQLSPEQTKTSLILGLRLENGSLAVKNGVVADCMERGGIIIVDEATHSVQEILRFDVAVNNIAVMGMLQSGSQLTGNMHGPERFEWALLL